jgi:hypothetical protein
MISGAIAGIDVAVANKDILPPGTDFIGFRAPGVQAGRYPISSVTISAYLWRKSRLCLLRVEPGAVGNRFPDSGNCLAMIRMVDRRKS